MSDFLISAHQWILAFHIISVMFWMAGMYYLPRLYVYHAEAVEKNQPIATFEIMEEKLLKIIINPGMIAAWFFGLLLLFTPNLMENAGYWLPVKLICLFVLVVYHVFLSRWRRQFLQGATPKSSKFFRMINEIPPILTIIIVIMVVVKPF